MGKRLEGLGDQLILYARQFAWLTATPRRKDAKGNEERLARRIDQFRADEVEPPLPDVDPEPFWGWLQELGFTEPAGMGAAPISWRSLAEWQRLTGTALSPWDARMLRRLSTEYLAESHAAEDWARPAPWRRELTKAEQDAEQRRHLAVLGHYV